MTPEGTKAFNVLLGRMVVDDSLCELFLRDPDAVVANATEVLDEMQLAELRSIVWRLRSREPVMARCVENALRQADRCYQQ